MLCLTRKTLHSEIRLLLLFLIAFISIWVVGSSALYGENASATQASHSTSMKANADAQTAREESSAESLEEEPKSETVESVQEDVTKDVEEKTADKRQQLVKEAISAVSMTREALAHLDGGNTEESLDTLEKITGKLELLVARNPSLALIPIDVTTRIVDVIAKVETIETVVENAQEALEEGDVQSARSLLGNLASEVVVSTTQMPLATYPAAIKQVAPLIDNGKIEEAKQQLQTALNLLIVSDTVYPLPIMRADIMLKEAQALSEKSDRDKEENERLQDLLKEIRSQVEFGRELGYFTKENAESIYEELKAIEEKTSKGKSGQGFFEKIKGLFE